VAAGWLEANIILWLAVFDVALCRNEPFILGAEHRFVDAEISWLSVFFSKEYLRTEKA